MLSGTYRQSSASHPTRPRPSTLTTGCCGDFRRGGWRPKPIRDCDALRQRRARSADGRAGLRRVRAEHATTSRSTRRSKRSARRVAADGLSGQTARAAGLARLASSIVPTPARRRRGATFDHGAAALNLLNRPFLLQQVELFAERLAARSAGDDVDAQMRHALRAGLWPRSRTRRAGRAAALSPATGWRPFAARCSTPTNFLYVELIETVSSTEPARERDPLPCRAPVARSPAVFWRMPAGGLGGIALASLLARRRIAGRRPLPSAHDPCPTRRWRRGRRTSRPRPSTC